MPVTCCAHKGDELPRPENLAQCQMDAKMGVHNSVFIHMRVSILKKYTLGTYGK